MKKLLVAAVVLGLAGAAAIAGTRLSNGQCPLTGRPIHCLSSSHSTSSTAGVAAPMGISASADATAPSADAQECPQTRRPCCCQKKAPGPQAKSAPISALEAARCKGAEDAMTQAFTQPVTCGFAVLPGPILDAAPIPLLESKPVLPCSSTSLDKVPIERA